jgi:hypothetical protein
VHHIYRLQNERLETKNIQEDEVFTAMNMKSFTFWDIKPCSLMKSQPPFRRNTSHSAHCLLHAGSLLGLLFNPEDGRDTFLRNVSLLSLGNKMLYDRRNNS